MRLSLVCLLLNLLLTSAAQTQSYKQRDGFVGRVKFIRIEMVYLDQEGSPEGRERHLSGLRAYDINGNLTMYEDFYAYGKMPYGKDTYSYDVAGRMVEKAHEINGSTYKTIYSYNNKGQLLREDYQGRIKEYVYDSEGKLIEIKRFYNDGVDDGREVVSYNDNGRPAGHTFYKANGSLEARETKTYDAEGHLIMEATRYETKTYNTKGQLLSEVSGKNLSDPYYRKVIYEYDSRDYIAKEEVYDGKGLKETLAYTYENDAMGTWIKEVTTQINREEKKRIWETYRIITYY